MKQLPKEIQAILNTILNDKKDHKDISPRSKVRMGHLLTYVYDAKYKDKLPVWDELPLLVLLDIPDGKYILGINLHYIPYTYRLQFLKYLQTKNLKIQYRDIKAAWQKAKIPTAFAQLAIRKYLISHVRSKIKIFYDAEEQYEIVKQILPRFHKQKMAQVYQNINLKMKKQRQSLKDKA
mgnify:CR=1 FL=1